MIAVLHNYLIVGAILFTIGAIGLLTRRNLFLIVLSTEMMLQGVALNLLAFGRYHGNFEGQSFTVFVLTVAACDAAIALAIVLSLYHRKKTLDASMWRDLREETNDWISPSANRMDAPTNGSRAVRETKPSQELETSRHA